MLEISDVSDQEFVIVDDRRKQGVYKFYDTVKGFQYIVLFGPLKGGSVAAGSTPP